MNELNSEKCEKCGKFSEASLCEECIDKLIDEESEGDFARRKKYLSDPHLSVLLQNEEKSIEEDYKDIPLCERLFDV